MNPMATAIPTANLAAGLVRLRDLPEPGPVRTLFGPILPMGESTVIFGEKGAGKSYLACIIAVSVASGIGLIQDWSAQQAPVVVLDWETNQTTWRRRAAAVAAGGAIPIPNDLYYLRPHSDIASLDEGTMADIRAIGPGLVIVDSTRMASPTTSKGGDPSDAITTLYQRLRAFSDTSMLIDHVSKAEREQPYGSIFKVNIPREVFRLQHDEGDARRTLVHQWANERELIPDTCLEMNFTESGGLVTAVTVEIVAPRIIGNRDQVARAILRRDGPLPRAELRERMGDELGREITPANLSTMFSVAKTNLNPFTLGPGDLVSLPPTH